MIYFGPLVQLVEHCIRIAEIGSPTLLRSTTFWVQPVSTRAVRRREAGSQ